jgi:hypothetical protein
MRWRVTIEANIENVEGGLSGKRYVLWGNHYDSNDGPFIPRIGEHLSFTISGSPDIHLKVVDVVTRYINYDGCQVNIICDRVDKNE